MQPGWPRGIRAAVYALEPADSAVRVVRTEVTLDDIELVDGKLEGGGVSVELNRTFSIGAELLHEIEIPNWERAEDSIVFAGPNASVRFGRTYATAACLFQLTDVAGEPDVQTRLIFGISF